MKTTLDHLAIIMDGNRRWAKQNSLQPWQGHYHGIKSVEESIEFCLENKIKYLSLYTFSLENFKRSEQEKNYLFKLIIQSIKSFTHRIIENQIKINFIGNRNLFPNEVHEDIIILEGQTKQFKNLTLNILLCYGGQQEILNAINKIIKNNKKQDVNIDIENLKIEDFKKYLWFNDSKNILDIPDPNLIIRTGGQKRLSNFLLFQAAYSELYFIDTYWPDLKKQDLSKAIKEYDSRKRNYGK